MNTTALKAAFASLSFRCRLHAALMGAAKKKFAHYVKNRKGENFLRVEWQPLTGFIFQDKKGCIIPQKTIYSLIQAS